MPAASRWRLVLFLAVPLVIAGTVLVARNNHGPLYWTGMACFLAAVAMYAIARIALLGRGRNP